MLVPIVQLIVVNTIQTYKNKNKRKKCLYTLCLKKTGPLLHFQITPTILVQYQQILVQRIVN